MRIAFLILPIGLLLHLGHQTWGQVVQLPTFRVFTLSTTVSVPDQGSVSLGGVDYARSASVSRGVPVGGRLPVVGGPLRSHATGHSIGANRVSVTATIIDHREWDEAIRAMATEQPQGNPREEAIARRAEFLSRHVARHASAIDRTADPGSMSIEAIRLRNQRIDAERQTEARNYFARGQQALQEDRRGVAAAYFRLAVRRGNDQLRDRALAHIKAIAPAPNERTDK
jgi:hypothetical protein